MPRIQPTVFVLWGDRCDELVACTFVTVLRRAGLRVKLVGVSGRRNKGASGLTLTPDLSLREALPLASHAAAVVIPCNGETLRRMVADIQVVTLLENAGSGQGRLVVQADSLAALAPELSTRCLAYLADERLPVVAAEIGSLFGPGQGESHR